jgi:hypothetical protein
MVYANHPPRLPWPIIGQAHILLGLVLGQLVEATFLQTLFEEAPHLGALMLLVYIIDLSNDELRITVG